MINGQGFFLKKTCKIVKCFISKIQTFISQFTIISTVVAILYLFTFTLLRNLKLKAKKTSLINHEIYSEGSFLSLDMLLNLN